MANAYPALLGRRIDVWISAKTLSRRPPAFKNVVVIATQDDGTWPALVEVRPGVRCRVSHSNPWRYAS